MLRQQDKVNFTVNFTENPSVCNIGLRHQTCLLSHICIQNQCPGVSLMKHHHIWILSCPSRNWKIKLTSVGFHHTNVCVVKNIKRTYNQQRWLTYSALGIGYSGYRADRHSANLSMVISTAEQIYLPLASGHSKRKMCALAKSSVCTNGVLNRCLYSSW